MKRIDIWKALTDGKTIQNTRSLFCYKMVDGFLKMFVLTTPLVLNTSDQIFVHEDDYVVYIPPKPKKRYWLWDIKDVDGLIYKCQFYIDDDGQTTCYRKKFNKPFMIKKHENEYIDIEITELSLVQDKA